MDGLIQICAILALLLVVGGAIGLGDRGAFSVKWLLAAAALVLCNDALLTRGYHLLPQILPRSEWNWQGKILALAATLAIASLPSFGWRRSGLALIQARGSLKACIPVAVAYVVFFVAMAHFFPSGSVSPETVAFQLSMPGLEEEPFYRGVLLFALDRAFTSRARVLGVEWGWGAILSCALFGLAHAFSYAHGAFSFDAVTMALTALPSFIAVWIRLRSGSVLIPVLLHNFGNSIMLL